MCWRSWDNKLGGETTMDLLKEAFMIDIKWFANEFIRVGQSFFSKFCASFILFFSLDSMDYDNNAFFIFLLAKLMVLDLLIGCWDAKKNKTWSIKKVIAQGFTKFPVYALYVHLVRSIESPLEHAFASFGMPVQIPALEFFIAYLVIGEVYSILRHLHYIEFKVPKILLWFVFGFRKKIEKKLKEFFPNAGSIDDINPNDVFKKDKEV